jgi:hypothetical protein
MVKPALLAPRRRRGVLLGLHSRCCISDDRNRESPTRHGEGSLPTTSEMEKQTLLRSALVA